MVEPPIWDILVKLVKLQNIWNHHIQNIWNTNTLPTTNTASLFLRAATVIRKQSGFILGANLGQFSGANRRVLGRVWLREAAHETTFKCFSCLLTDQWLVFTKVPNFTKFWLRERQIPRRVFFFWNIFEQFSSVRWLVFEFFVYFKVSSFWVSCLKIPPIEEVTCSGDSSATKIHRSQCSSNPRDCHWNYSPQWREVHDSDDFFRSQRNFHNEGVVTTAISTREHQHGAET